MHKLKIIWQKDSLIWGENVSQIFDQYFGNYYMLFIVVLSSIAVC